MSDPEPDLGIESSCASDTCDGWMRRTNNQRTGDELEGSGPREWALEILIVCEKCRDARWIPDGSTTSPSGKVV